MLPLVCLYISFISRKDSILSIINQDSSYYAIMSRSIGDKARLLDYVVPGHILEIGFGGGELMDILHESGNTVYGLDASDVSVDRVSDKPYFERVVEAFADETFEAFGANKFDTVIMSSVLHEVFSYGSRNSLNARTMVAWHDAIANIAKTIKPGGRLLIRDGVMADNYNEAVTLTMLNKDVQGIHDYLDLQPFPQISLTQISDTDFIGNMESVASTIYTYTWGPKSLPRESQELYGLATLDDYASNVESHGFSCKYKQAYVRSGYVDHLSSKVLLTQNGQPVGWPPTNALWIFEKTD